MRTAFLLSIPYDPKLVEDVRQGKHPQPDYLALADRLEATIIAPIRKQQNSPLGKAWGFFKTAWAGFRQRRNYDVIISDKDRVGLLLALMLKVARARTRHIVICHSKMVSALDSRVVKTLGLSTQMNEVVCYGQQAADMLAQKVPELTARITVVRHGQDHRFWQPQGSAQENLIVGAGLFRRDYETLVEAVDGLDVSVEIAAHSPWVTNEVAAPKVRPANVKFERHNYQGLRALYDRALCVAVPLLQTHSQAGSLVIYEAMAMGKAVIVTRTDGQASMGLVEEGKTGYYVEPQDVKRWREVIQGFIDDPLMARKMGARAREAVEAGMTMEAYAEQMAQVLYRGQPTDQHSQAKQPRLSEAPERAAGP